MHNTHTQHTPSYPHKTHTQHTHTHTQHNTHRYPHTIHTQHTPHTHDTHRYPDGSVYTGSWAGGKKDGPGVYWDIAKGCMRGNWSKGVLKGHAVYDQPALHYEGEFVRVRSYILAVL